MRQNADEIREKVRSHYSKVATGNGCGCSNQVLSQSTGCCSPEASLSKEYNSAIGYSEQEIEGGIAGSNMNLGCGNPLAIARLESGQHVLDLGSGGGFDCFLAARAVGPTGHVIGVDMTPEMVIKARENLTRAEVTNVSFRLGEIEHLPVADESIDVILSNCVINLSPKKSQVWQETFRVLKPGGRLAISDVVALQPLPTSLQKRMDLVAGCIGGAERVESIREHLEKTGFEDVEITINTKSAEVISTWFPETGAEHYVSSATIEARKPAHPVLRLPQNRDWIQDVAQKAERNMAEHGNCTQSIVSAFVDVLNIRDPSLSRVSSGFLGGMTCSRTCGINSAAVLLLGYFFGRNRIDEGMDAMYSVVFCIRQTLKQLDELMGAHACQELTGVDFRNTLQAMQFQNSNAQKRCIAWVGEGARIIATILHENAMKPTRDR